MSNSTTWKSGEESCSCQRISFPPPPPAQTTEARGCQRLLYLPVFHDQDEVTVEDRVEAVGDGQHCAAFEGVFDGTLHKAVSLGVHGGSGFIKENDLLGKKYGKSHSKPKLYLEVNS